MPPVHTWEVPDELAGNRVDKLVAVLGGVSRSVAKDAVAAGNITVDGVQPDASDRVNAGALIAAELPDAAGGLTAADIEFSVVWEDESIVVVNKPPGLVVHPGAGHRDDTLANGLLHRYPQLEALGDSHRWGIVHRIDRTTSGLLLVAKTGDAHAFLQAALKRRDVSRRYWALAWGSFDAATGTIDAPIARHPTQPTKMAVVADGKPARTHYVRIAGWTRPDLTLLDVALETGRTHQIRVHGASIGHAIVGDRTYGRPGPPGVDPGRVWLHARRLAFPHPETGEVVEVDASLPDDLRAGLDVLGEPETGELPHG